MRGDCLDILPQLEPDSIDLVYLDPPFCTQKYHRSTTRDRRTEYAFSDMWKSIEIYGAFLRDRMKLVRRVLKATGTVFFHCDSTASHIARLMLDECFGPQHFQSEIVWHYRRWSNSKKNLLPTHQTILFYSKTGNYKFNRLMTEYSPSTNVDQLLQKRARDKHNKSVYARDEEGRIIPNGQKSGVPLGDVWDIPYLNPKARERTGYPTQKPILLLERIISLVTDIGDTVLDPFCGSGTTLVAAKLMNRNSIGIDCSADAIELSRNRLNEPVKTESTLLRMGRDAYKNASSFALDVLAGVNCIPVQRNKGIDALLGANGYVEKPIPIRVQRQGETLQDATEALITAARSKHPAKMIVVKTRETNTLIDYGALPDDVVVITSPQLQIEMAIDETQIHA